MLKKCWKEEEHPKKLIETKSIELSKTLIVETEIKTTKIIVDKNEKKSFLITVGIIVLTVTILMKTVLKNLNKSIYFKKRED